MSEACERPFVVIAEFWVRPDSLDTLLALAHDDASASVADEPGCWVFDVAVDAIDPLSVVFYEVYDGRADFDAHLATPHLALLREGCPNPVAEERPVRFLGLQRSCGVGAIVERAPPGRIRSSTINPALRFGPAWARRCPSERRGSAERAAGGR